MTWASILPTRRLGAVRWRTRLDFNTMGALKLMEIAMGKYLLGWVLGVPAIVLVVAYFFFH